MSAAHLAAVRQTGCRICGRTPATAHHVRGGSLQAILGVIGRRKVSDYLAIGLCEDHHQGQYGVHKMGPKAWEAAFGTQVEFVHQQARIMGLNLWLMAENHEEAKRENRVYKPPVKNLKPDLDPLLRSRMKSKLGTKLPAGRNNKRPSKIIPIGEAR